jgi:predicted permease
MIETLRSREAVIREARQRSRLIRFWYKELSSVIRSGLRLRMQRDERSVTKSRERKQSTAARVLCVARQDVQFAVRTLHRHWVLTSVVVLTLALGIGASVATFNTLYAALLRPLPFPTPDRLVMGRAVFNQQLNPWAAGADYYDYHDRAEAFDNLAAFLPFPQEYTVTGGERAERAAGFTVSTNFFATLGVRPQAGRDFATEEGLQGASDVALISHSYWQSHFGGAHGAVGRTIVVNGRPYAVVGIMPPDFRFMSEVEFWLPMRADRDAAAARDRHNWLLVARLKPNVTLEQAQTQVDVISAQLEQAYPETNTGKSLLLTELHDVLMEDYRATLFIVTAAVGLVLLIACGNVTGILLARAPARRTELSVRAAVGAARSRLISQLLAETLVLALVAGLAGTVIALFLQQSIVDFTRVDLPGNYDRGFSAPLLCFAVVFSLAAGLLAGVYPALGSVRGNLAQDLRAGARTIEGGGLRFRSGLVVAQVAASVILLIGSGLLIRSFASVLAVNPGFDPHNVIAADVELPSAAYAGRDARVEFYGELVERIRAIPGVQSASLVNLLPIREPRNVFRVTTAEHPDQANSVYLRAVPSGYFETMRIPLLGGRAIEAGDAANASQVCLISEAAATVLLRGNPLGRELTLDWFGTPLTVEVVGVVGDVRMSGLDAAPGLTLYVPYPQIAYPAMRIVARTDVVPTSIADELRDAVWALDENIPVSAITTMDDVIDSSVSRRRVIAMSLTLYAVLPLVMAAVGLYAVLAYHVTQRFHEIGIRMALGADAARIGWLVLGRGIGLIGLGLALGIGGAVAATRLLQQMLFGIQPTDPTTFVGVGLFVLAVALLAGLVPVWRAVRVDPQIALKD